LGKYRSLMPTLALIFHLVDIADGSGSGPVSMQAAGMAAAWCDYLEAHARRVYGMVASLQVQAARLKSSQSRAVKKRKAGNDCTRNVIPGRPMRNHRRVSRRETGNL